MPGYTVELASTRRGAGRPSVHQKVLLHQWWAGQQSIFAMPQSQDCSKRYKKNSGESNDLIVALNDFRVVESNDVSEHADMYCACVLSVFTPFFVTLKFAIWKYLQYQNNISQYPFTTKEMVNFPVFLVKAFSITHLNIRLNAIVAS